MEKLSYEIYVVSSTGHMYMFAQGITVLTEALHKLRQVSSSITNGEITQVVRAELVTVVRTVLN